VDEVPGGLEPPAITPPGVVQVGELVVHDMRPFVVEHHAVAEELGLEQAPRAQHAQREVEVPREAVGVGPRGPEEDRPTVVERAHAEHGVAGVHASPHQDLPGLAAEHLRDLAPGDVPHSIHAVTEEEPDRRGAGRPLQPLRLCEALVQLHIDGADVADRLLFRDRPPERLHLGPVPVPEVHHQRLARAGYGLLDGEAVLHRGRQRLLAEHVKPRLQRRDHGGAMRLVRRRHHHRLQPLPRQHLGEVRVAARRRPLSGKTGGARRVEVGDGDELGLAPFGQALRVEAAHGSRPDQPDAHHLTPPFARA
jgi:hypothetical protein